MLLRKAKLYFYYRVPPPKVTSGTLDANAPMYAYISSLSHACYITVHHTLLDVIMLIIFSEEDKL
jgi:hypothetical protein